MEQDINSFKSKDVTEEIKQYKRINKRNDIIIIALSAVLIFSLVMMIYVRFFG